MKKILIGINICLLVTFLLCSLRAFRLYEAHSDNYYNNARLLLADDIKNIQAGDFEGINRTFYLANLQGEIVYSKDEGFPIGKTLNMQEIIQTDHIFTAEHSGKIKLVFPVMKLGTMDGFAVFTIEKKLIQNQSDLQWAFHLCMPFLIWGTAVILIFVFLTISLKRRVLNPVEELSDSANAIISGDYNVVVVQKNTKDILGTEMDRLCYSFELMRDEIKNKSEREKQLQMAHKELLSCMSHDLRTPISTIKAHAEAMRDGMAETEEKRSKFIETIIRKTDVLSHMISDLLDHSNAECNQLSIILDEFYLKEFFEVIAKELEIYCQKFETEILVENSAPDVLIYADRGRLTQVVYNLVENAVKYNTNTNKKIWFCCQANEEEKRIYFSVEDNGIGVSLSDISFVFDSFYRAEKSRSMQIPGAGLGLSICRYIIEAHGGEIFVESRSEQGAKFIFYLCYD